MNAADAIEVVAAKKTATIARRNTAEAELTDQTCTPKWLCDLLPRVGMDVCSNPRSHVRADIHVMLEAFGIAVGASAITNNGMVQIANGLEIEWAETIFDNHPFSNPMPWMRKLQHEIAHRHVHDAIVLCKADCGSKWWAELTRKTSWTVIERWDFHKRVQYDEHPDVIEARRLERVRQSISDPKSPWFGKPVEKIHGRSQANFTSVIVHHRDPARDPLPLGDVATRWVMA